MLFVLADTVTDGVIKGETVMVTFAEAVGVDIQSAFEVNITLIISPLFKEEEL